MIDPDLLDPSFDLAEAGEEDRRTVLERLRRAQEAKGTEFEDKMKLWDQARHRQEEYDEQIKVIKGTDSSVKRPLHSLFLPPVLERPQ